MSPVTTTYCSVCECIEEDTASRSLCPDFSSVSNGLCNPENNVLTCNYDGGDCCPNADLIGNGQCDFVNYNHICQFDGGDCCFENHDYHHVIANDHCTYFHNLEMCNYDKEDCCNSSSIADGICDDVNNNRLCHFDGGDCCVGNKNTSRCSFCQCFNVFDVISIVAFVC